MKAIEFANPTGNEHDLSGLLLGKQLPLVNHVRGRLVWFAGETQQHPRTDHRALVLHRVLGLDSRAPPREPLAGGPPAPAGSRKVVR